MRVLIVAWYANRSGGADVYTESLARGLADRGHRVTVVCHDASPTVEASCRVVRVTKPEFANWPLAWRVAPALVAAHWTRHLMALDGVRPDVAVVSPAVCVAAVQRKFPGVPVVYLPHARIAPLEVAGTVEGVQSRILQRVAVGLLYRAERRALLRSDITVRFTRGNADALASYYQLPSRVRFEVIPQSVDVPHSPTRTSSHEAGARLLFVGRLVPSKNLGMLLDCLGRLRHHRWRLDVVGDGPDRATLESRAISMGLADRVSFHGQRDCVGPYYADADLLAFPSRLENVSLVVLEAMGHGVPALVVRHDGVAYQNAHHEVISHGCDSLIADGEVGFESTLDQCLTSPDVLTELGRAARKRALATHTWCAALNRWERILADATTSRQSLRSRVATCVAGEAS